ncbi:chitobiosyldiphosphodolichol beta-mannosyltransferase isoform X1 [Leptidea sinapis]|uniref:chitobiosyldiphosphodolichol beta-mannosyltransferase isoform X1 n=1 Tax=Leptidea sinapis TaxID=189913 RepID=UPI0021364F54|nr:chitobiosyldiphosphodolichol beta-mannosyltransferase isoform X1 [Leptidea sinapis]
MEENYSKKVVKVVVLGDIGRSPRMQYHALSLAHSGFNVNIIGYLESSPLPEILNNPNITVTKLVSLKLNAPKIIQYFAKTLWQTFSLFLTLLITRSCDYLICQNPPAIPTLPVCRFYCLVTKTKFIIDWHNYAYSIMALSLKPSHPLLRLATGIEKCFGQSSDHNLCVTCAMKDDLIENWGIVATVLYDRPPKIFHPITVQEKHNWFLKLGAQFSEFMKENNAESCVDVGTKTLFTEIVGTDIVLRSGRPGLLFSSTSWTPDEDFGVLLEALQIYETSYSLSKHLPKLLCVITGKGPMKEYYQKQIASRNWQHVKVVTPWLDACDYPTMVASADLGVCLHTSSSGLDLPMKVVDMFGAGLPVCAFEFKCINELIEDGTNGYTFKTSDELSKQIIKWFDKFPNNIEQNEIAQRMRNELNKFQESRWEDNWQLRARKFFN